MRKLFLAAIIILLSQTVNTQVFEPVKVQPQGRMHASAAWIDVNGDGKLDFIVSGDYQSGSSMLVRTSYYQQTGKDLFKLVGRGLPDFYLGAIDVGDFNRNGRQDVVLTGMGANNTPVSGIYLAQADGSFRKADVNLPALTGGSVEFGDFDNDGFLDVLISGRDINGRPVTAIYRNQEGQLTEVNANLPGIGFGKATWGDLNKNGMLDVLICGNGVNGPITQIYVYLEGRYRPIPQRFPGLYNSDAAWADFDNDGKLDFIISGETSGGIPTTRIFRNMGNLQFIEETAHGLRPLKNATIDIADYDADGDLDILMTGESLERPYTILYENRGNFRFTNAIAGLPGVSTGTARFGDYDADGDPDIIVFGLDVCFEIVGKIFRNNTNPAIERDDPVEIFIESPVVDYSKGPYYYFVWSSCFCDPYGGDNKGYHMFISNIHRERRDFDLNYKFNEILTNRFPNWGEADRGHRSSNAFISIPDAEGGRQQTINSYRAEGFQIHFFNW